MTTKHSKNYRISIANTANYQQAVLERNLTLSLHDNIKRLKIAS